MTTVDISYHITKVNIKDNNRHTGHMTTIDRQGLLQMQTVRSHDTVVRLVT